MNKPSIRPPLMLSILLGFSLPVFADCGPQASEESKDEKVAQASQTPAYVGTSKEAGNEADEDASGWSVEPGYDNGGYNP
jgi:hypothetical protein